MALIYSKLRNWLWHRCKPQVPIGQCEGLAPRPLRASLRGNFHLAYYFFLRRSLRPKYCIRTTSLDEKEALYFLSSKDSNGNPLTSDFDYQIIGTPPKGRYWSYTLYGEDYFLVKNIANIYTINKENLTKDKPIQISSSKKDINWLPSGNETKFHITLRVYNPDESVYKNLESIDLPIIKKIEK